jgi:hypothetical protein
MEKLGCLVFKSMAHELEYPSQKKKSESDRPKSMEEDTGQEDDYGEQNERYAQRMAGAVDGILVAGRILRNPLLVAASAQHGRDHTPIPLALIIENVRSARAGCTGVRPPWQQHSAVTSPFRVEAH